MTVVALPPRAILIIISERATNWHIHILSVNVHPLRMEQDLMTEERFPEIGSPGCSWLRVVYTVL